MAGQEKGKGAEGKGEGSPKKTRRPSALKRDLQSEKRRVLNKSFRSKVATAINSLKDAVKKSEKDRAKNELNGVYSLLDKGAKKGVFKLNKANRTKSRLSKKVPS